MQLQPWKIHILGFDSRVKPAKDQIQSLGLRWLNTGLLAFQKEPAQSFVFEALYHAISVTIMVTWVKLPNLTPAVLPARPLQPIDRSVILKTLPRPQKLEGNNSYG